MKFNIATEEMRFAEYVKHMEETYGIDPAYITYPKLTINDMKDLMVAIDKESEKLGYPWYDEFYEYELPAMDEFNMFAYAQVNDIDWKHANYEVGKFHNWHYDIDVYYIQAVSFTIEAQEAFSDCMYVASTFTCMRRAILNSGLENRYAILYSLIRTIAHLPETYRKNENHEKIINDLTVHYAWKW